MRQNVTPGLDRAVKLHPADPNRMLDITVSLSFRNQPALNAFIQRVSDPRSSSYGRYLTSTQFAAAYGPTPDDVQQVIDHLRRHGLTVGSVSSNRMLVDAAGPVRSVEAAFGVTISDWHDRDLDRDFFGNDTQPSVPAAIAPSVVGVLGLNNHYRFHHAATRAPRLAPRVPPGNGPAGGYTPSNLKTAYGVDPLAASGISGSGQGIGLFELDQFNQANITKYDTQYGLVTSAPVVQLVDGGPPLGLGQVEVELDIEVAQAFAPGAGITVFEAPNTDIGAVHGFTAMVSSNMASNSTSWGACEPLTSASFMDSLHQIFQQAAAQGQSFFAASGDFGAFDCANSQPPSNQLAVDNPASDPLTTGVGGTTLTINALNSSYISESAWSTTATTPHEGTGGGLSAHFLRPAWQTGPGVANAASNGYRQVPDVALDADPATGFSVCVTTCQTQPAGMGWSVIGGTSGAAPSWAAFTALYNQYAVGAGRPMLGFANPMLYNLGSNPQMSPPFHDITTGNNLNYNATVGWDYPTGWGTPQVSNLIVDITQNPAAPLWVRHAVAAAAGGSPPTVASPWYQAGAAAAGGSPPTPWYRRPASAAGAATLSVVMTPAATMPATAVVPEPVRRWAAAFMPQLIGRLTSWFSA